MISERRMHGTTWRGSKPKMRRIGVSVVPYPIPNVESMYSHKKAMERIRYQEGIKKPGDDKMWNPFMGVAMKRKNPIAEMRRTDQTAMARFIVSPPA